ncbi:SOS response-associated peptidase [Carboxylicivirga sp. N1Y90]|uniref:SOS response-associated peptidase n=1 Tax=Carboxylicivirga fragile TaxID=3417571 RepID=UPI003D332FBA|nr:SOS response-associated peptidase [Marinilabiliaceae bacterium N1Y90]
MCYDIKSKLETQLKRAKHYNNEAWIAELEKELKPYLDNDHHHASGFTHPTVLIYTCDKPYEPLPFQWGLVPYWTKDELKKNQIWNKTINARSETIFEKPSFKKAAANQRCLVYIDGFYEHHHYNGKAYPYYIYRLDGQPLVLGGLYDQWLNVESGELLNTFSVVTTKANDLMRQIHNNPKLAEPRMPLIFNTDESADLWMSPSNDTANSLEDLFMPLADGVLGAHTVAPLRGKNALGNVCEVSDKVDYEGLRISI